MINFGLLNNYLNDLGDLNELFNNNSPTEIQNIIIMSLRYLSIELCKNKNNDDIINILNKRIKKIEKIEKIENNKTNEYKKKYNEIINKLNKCSKELNLLMNNKKKIDYELIELFKDKNKEVLKIDEMSKKSLEIIDKMNWATIDPGTNSLLTMLSKDGKTHYTYSKCKYISKTKRKETLNKIERIKKEK
jgi:hypothetical protein